MSCSTGTVGVQVFYGIDGESPQAVVFYLRTDKTFPKLQEDNLDQRLAWEQERINLLADYIDKRLGQ